MDQSLAEADNLQADLLKPIDYDDLVVSYMKDKSIGNLITQRLHLINKLKDEEENKLKSVKAACREAEIKNDLIKNSVSENCMLVHSWTKYSSEHSNIEAKNTLIKQLAADEIKLYEDQIQYLKESHNKYVLMNDSLQPFKLQEALNDLSDEKLTAEQKISFAKDKLKKLNTVVPKSYNMVDLGMLKEVDKQLEEELPSLNEQIKLLDKQNAIDRDFIKKLNEEMKIYEQEN